MWPRTLSRKQASHFFWHYSNHEWQRKKTPHGFKWKTICTTSAETRVRKLYSIKGSFLRRLIKTDFTSSTYKSNLWGFFVWKQTFSTNFLCNDFGLKEAWHWNFITTLTLKYFMFMILNKIQHEESITDMDNTRPNINRHWTAKVNFHNSCKPFVSQAFNSTISPPWFNYTVKKKRVWEQGNSRKCW